MKSLKSNRRIGLFVFKFLAIATVVTTLFLGLSQIKKKGDKIALLKYFNYELLFFVENIEGISIVAGLIAFIWSFPDQQKKSHYEAWQVISLAKGQSGSGGRIQALQDLAEDGVSLAGVNIKNAYLAEVNLSGTDLTSANFANSVLRYSNLSRAILSKADFSKADLSNANLNYADLSGADILRIIPIGREELGNSNIATYTLEDRRIELPGVTKLILADLGSANLSNADLRNAVLSGSNLRNAVLSGSNLSNAVLTFADLRGAKLRNVKLKDAILNHSLYNKKTEFPQNFKPANQKMYLIAPDADLSNAHLFSANLSDTDLSNANLSGALLGFANLSNADLSNADLSNADLRDADLNGAIFWHKESGREAKNITPKQIKQAKNWEKATYSPEFREELGLPPEE